MSKLGIGFWIFILFLIVVAARNTDGDWFTPDKRSTAEMPKPDELRFDLTRHDQVLIVTTDRWGDNHATVALWERNDKQQWENITGDDQARIGLNGFKINRQEGDGTTPAGVFGLTAAFGAAEKGGTGLRYTQIMKGQCWISDSKDPAYNTWTTRPSCGLGNVDLYEQSKNDGPYNKAIVVDFNTSPIKPLVGSAIFVYRNEYVNGDRGPTRPTKAGITVSRNDLDDLFRLLSDDLQPVIILGPHDWIVGPKESTGIDGEKLDLPAPAPTP